MGQAPSDCRLTVWSATLSTTWKGMPLLAFGEVTSVALLLAHALLGVCVTRICRTAANATRARAVIASIGIITCLLAGAAVIALATGRR